MCGEALTWRISRWCRRSQLSASIMVGAGHAGEVWVSVVGSGCCIMPEQIRQMT